jgi:hypothetical protein
LIQKGLENFVPRNGTVTDLLKVNVIACVVKNMGKIAADVFCAGAVAMQLQKVPLEHGRALTRIIHLL